MGPARWSEPPEQTPPSPASSERNVLHSTAVTRQLGQDAPLPPGGWHELPRSDSPDRKLTRGLCIYSTSVPLRGATLTNTSILSSTTGTSGPTGTTPPGEDKLGR